MESKIILSIIGAIGGVIGTIIGTLGFAYNRQDRSTSNAKDESYHLGQIDSRLNNIEKVLGRIEKIFESLDKEIEKEINKAIEIHEKEYHNKI